MTYYPKYKCWEIMNCENYDCPVRCEPQIPCWEIVKKAEAYHAVSNTCKDCAVYLLKEKSSALSSKEVQSIITNTVLTQNSRKNHQGCIK